MQINNHSQLLNDTTGCKEKEVKVGEYQFYLNNGFSADTLRGFRKQGDSE